MAQKAEEKKENDSNPKLGPPDFFSVNKYAKELCETAAKVATRGKGILAADESTGTIGKRLKMISVENTTENSQRYRELLFTTKDLGKYISGVIMFDQTIRQSSKSGATFVKLLNNAGIVVGIKVDQGTRELPYFPGEKYGQGLGGLDDRVQEYYKLGARFAKWRSVVTINNGYVSETCIKETAWTLARYAAICQWYGLVPIVEPEILMDGAHSVELCEYWTTKVVTACYKALCDQNVILEGTLLKPNMVLAGSDWKGKRSPQTNADCTVRALKRSVPAAVPGIMFLSGGQSEEEATVNLNGINKGTNLPWSASFSYGRALQQSCLKAWKGEDKNVKAAQAALIVRAKANSEAQLGKYKGDAASKESTESLHVKGYVY